MITESELIQRLQALSVDWPEPVDVTDRVMERVGTTRRGWLPSVSVQRGISFALVIVVAASVSVLLLVPGARTAVARFLGFPGIAVEVSSEPLPDLQGMESGEVVTLAEAEARTGLDLRTLPLPGGRVTVDDETRAVHIAYRYEGGRVALLTQLRGDGELAFNKQSPQVVPTEVNGAFALWVAGGGEHAVMRGAGGRVEARLSENALLWSSGGVTYRLELAAELPEAVRLAESLR